MNTPITGGPSSLSRFLGQHQPTLAVLAMVVLLGTGEKMAERFLPIYLLALGGGPLVIGLLQAMDNLLSALYSYPGGYLSDKLGTSKALLVFNCIAMAGYGLVIIVPTWQAVLAGAVLFISWSAVSLPATLSLLFETLPKSSRIMGVSIYSMVNRIPMAIGPLLGGIFIGIWGERDGVRLAFLTAFLLAGVSIFLQRRLLDHRIVTAAPPDALAGNTLANPLPLFKVMNPSLKRLLVADVLIRYCEQMPYAFVVIWCMKEIAQPVTAAQFGLLTAVEMTVATLIYLPVAYFADRGAKKPYIAATFAFFTVFPLILLVCDSFWALLPAFVVRGMKEFGEPTRKTLIMELAPAKVKAAMFGLYYLIRDSLVAFAAILGAVLWQVGPELTLWLAAAFGLAGTLIFIIYGRDLPMPQHLRS